MRWVWGSCPLLVGLVVAGVGDPGNEHAVRVVDEVIPRQGIDELALPAPVCGRDRHELAIAGCGRDTCGPSEQSLSVRGEERRRDKDQWILTGERLLDDRCDRRVVAHQESAEQLRWFFRRHAPTIQTSADKALTPLWRP